MSTKIWTAWRLTRGRDLWPLVPVIRARAEREVRRTLIKAYVGLLGEWRNSPAFHAACEKEYAAAWAFRAPHRKEPMKLGLGPTDVSDFVRAMYRAQLCQDERNTYDLTVQIVARKSRRGWLLIPYPGSGILQSTLRFLARMPELEDYHYQNSTDGPEEVSARAWRERRDTWSPLIADSSFRDKLVIDILSSADSMVHLDPVWDRTGKHVAMFRRLHREAYPEATC